MLVKIFELFGVYLFMFCILGVFAIFLISLFKYSIEDAIHNKFNMEKLVCLALATAFSIILFLLNFILMPLLLTLGMDSEGLEIFSQLIGIAYFPVSFLLGNPFLTSDVSIFIFLINHALFVAVIYFLFNLKHNKSLKKDAP